MTIKILKEHIVFGKKCLKRAKKWQIRQVEYYWNDHCLIREMPLLMNLINECIKKHDYYTFTFLQYLLNNFDFITKETCGEFKELIGKPIMYLPSYVRVVYTNGRDTYRKMDKKMFNKISYSEYECG